MFTVTYITLYRIFHVIISIRRKTLIILIRWRTWLLPGQQFREITVWKPVKIWHNSLFM